MSVNVQLHFLMSEVFLLAKRRIDATIVFNCHRRPTENRALYDLLNRSSNSRILNWLYSYGTLSRLFDVYAILEGAAVIINLFDQDSGAFMPRVFAIDTWKVALPTAPTHQILTVNLGVVSCPNALLTNTLMTVLSKEHSVVACVNNGNVSTCVAYDVALAKLVRLVEAALLAAPSWDVSLFFLKIGW